MSNNYFIITNVNDNEVAKDHVKMEDNDLTNGFHYLSDNHQFNYFNKTVITTNMKVEINLTYKND